MDILGIQEDSKGKMGNLGYLDFVTSSTDEQVCAHGFEWTGGYKCSSQKRRRAVVLEAWRASLVGLFGWVGLSLPKVRRACAAHAGNRSACVDLRPLKIFQCLHVLIQTYRSTLQTALKLLNQRLRSDFPHALRLPDSVWVVTGTATLSKEGEV